MLASASTGLMNSVLEKLSSLMADESTKLVGVHKQLQFLHHELSSMRGALEDVADMEDLNNETKAWRNEVTELAYDTEDCIDDFRHRVESPHDGQGWMCRAARLLKTLMARYQISRKIEELRTRVQEASDHRTSLVGIDAPKEEVIKLLTKVDDASPQELRVVSIVGFGGLGKTTLANEVYRNLRLSFSCKAIISVSQRPDMMSLLNSLFSKVSGQGANHANDLQGLIDNLREYLQGKRYFLVVDDLWDASAWEIIKCAFPESHCGSRVLTTTRIERVAVASCNYQLKFVYRMKPLGDHHSRQLFLQRVFGSADTCPEPFEGLQEKILQKCGGLPLAIITIASLLASQPTRSIEQWKFVLNSLCHNLGLDPTLEGMRQTLNLSYTHLPHPLKACILYIGMYPEDYEIQRDDLVVQCVAEGFISGVDGREAVEVAGSYLNELVNRSMIIQHVKYGARGDRIIYRVHDMVLDLILSKSTEENFLCAVENLQAISTRQRQYKARRLSLQFQDRSLVESAGRVSLPHVRSLIIFGWPHGSLELLELKFIRALYIERATNELDLTLISKLFQLRCLCVRGNYKRLQLPEEIIGLQHLEAVIILSDLSNVPRDIVSLPALLYLQFPPAASYPIGIGNMKCLHTLRSFDPSKQSVANTWALGELLNLRVLDLLIAGGSFANKGAHMDALMSSLEKLISCNLKTLSIIARDNVGRHGRWSSLCFSCSHLEQLHLLYFKIQRMPAWVCQLRALSSLKIKVGELCEDDVAVLAGLPVLARLVLDAEVVPAEGVVFSGGTAFRVLGYLRAPYVAEAGVTFQAGSTPQVEVLRLLVRASDVQRRGVKLAGIEHLTNLKQVLVNLRNGDCDESEVPAIKEEIRSAFDAHPASSSIQIEFY
ncbi:hypothetical protein SEVIR_7G297600v4 [Setaria viridis]|uniref:NB-ARC domain-containing protein n=1 Tax=Setaria viridis TaxID=4556 RepID=A0A4U6TZN7_SETVI|nr:disease resistance protein RGA5-like isoform X4 [Setaria viridis]TKW07314.1 hypothetical protein SEVIR_7G297600v2 [Setaria viridis]TKW07315.1 hypothetical protein SEVIR_7G297600v2 [Setaria viridis]